MFCWVPVLRSVLPLSGYLEDICANMEPRVEHIVYPKSTLREAVDMWISWENHGAPMGD